MSLSRIGKLPIEIPSGVTITVDSGNVTVEGPKGKLVQFITPAVNVKVEDGKFTVEPKDESQEARAQHGLMRALVNNMVIGVTKGYEKRLEVKGVGFRVASSNNELTMSLGFSHEVKFKAPEGVNVSNDKMVIIVSGIDKQKSAKSPPRSATSRNLSHTRARASCTKANKFSVKLERQVRNNG